MKRPTKGAAKERSNDLQSVDSDFKSTFTTFPDKFGKFRIHGLLGSGGQGEVYKASDDLDRVVALKVPYANMAREDFLRDAFLNEGTIGAKFDHLNICKVFEFGGIDGIPYLALQFIDGASLSDHLKDRTLVPDTNAACNVVRQLALALSDFHARGLLHRDLSPHNVRMTKAPEARPVLIDFGLAVRLNARESCLPGAGKIEGKLYYMPPEQINPGYRTPLGVHTDVYALGAVLYELVTRKPPFADKEIGPKLSTSICNEAPTWPHELSAAEVLRAICLRALSKKPRDRFANMIEFAEALRGFSQNLPQVASENSSPLSRPLVKREAIRFAFAKYGEAAPSNLQMSNRLFLDVGNDLRPGVIDHHHLIGSAGSTTSLIENRVDLIDASVAPGGADEFTIILHQDPDLDCVASAFLAVEYLTNRTLPRNVSLLSSYVDRADAGEACMPYSLYAAQQRLVSRPGSGGNSDRWMRAAESGLKVVEYVLGRIDQGESIERVDAFAAHGIFGDDDRKVVTDDLKHYEDKLADHARTNPRVARLQLPSQFGGMEELDALLVRDVQTNADPSRVAYFKDWARSDYERSPNEKGFAALSVFESETASSPRRCILSVTPRSYASLRGLGELIDRAESDARKKVFNGKDNRNDDPITGKKLRPRGGYSNADPWYDGRAHNFTIVDSPREGTFLSADEIEQIFLDYGHGEAKPLRL